MLVKIWIFCNNKKHSPLLSGSNAIIPKLDDHLHPLSLPPPYSQTFPNPPILLSPPQMLLPSKIGGGRAVFWQQRKNKCDLLNKLSTFSPKMGIRNDELGNEHLHFASHLFERQNYAKWRRKCYSIERDEEG
ncbi:hypothetical protein GPALN_012785 [Globodera pallida]|nr:hypothetical protein GPALN_012785 [Globodera pallida]